jgi:hypothetical protein
LLYAHIHRSRGGWSHYTDTSEPVDGNGAQNIYIDFHNGISGFEVPPLIKVYAVPPLYRQQAVLGLEAYVPAYP